MTITAFTYAGAYLIDRFCSSPYPTERVFSPVANKAGLWGMGYKERMDVLERLFANKQLIQKYDKATMMKMDKPMEIEMTDMTGKSSNGTTNPETTTENESDTGDIEQGSKNAVTSYEEDGLADAGLCCQDMDEIQTSLCSICLAEFGKYFLWMGFH